MISLSVIENYCLVQNDYNLGQLNQDYYLRGLTIREYLFISLRITIGNGKLIPTWKNHAPLRLSSKVFNLTPLPPGKPCVIIEVNKIVSDRCSYTLYILLIFFIIRDYLTWPPRRGHHLITSDDL